MRTIMSSAMALGFAASLALAPLALADEHPGAHPEAKVPPHPVAHPVVHKTVIHKTVNNTHVNEHVTAHVNEHVTEHVAPRVGGPIDRVGVGGGRWQRGGHYTGDRTPFRDWGRYHLHAPGPGYQWSRDGNEFVLIAIATGIVAETAIAEGE